MHERILKFSTAEFERGVERLVARLFAANRALPDETCEIPVIGWMRGFEYDPHGTREQHAKLERLAVMALLARRWFELYEAPKWALPLPLTEEDIVACFNPGERQSSRGRLRARLAGEYGRHLRGLKWELRNAMPFEVYCAQLLNG